MLSDRAVFQKRRVPVLLIAIFGASGCEAGAAPHPGQSAPKPAVTAAPAPKVADLAPAPDPAPAHPPAPEKHGVEFRGSVEWHTWEEALPLAAKQSKPIFVLVYADWCPHCKELGPVFANPEIEALSKRFVMVRQNHDDDPPWLQPYNQKYGEYVPRIFFFSPKGEIREDVTSGHPRYPYFYAAGHTEFLTASMRRVAGS